MLREVSTIGAMKRFVVGLVLLAACAADEPATDTAAEAARAIAAREATERQCAVDEALLKNAIEQTRELAAHAEEIVLYEVANEFDSDYEKWRRFPSVIGYPIKRRSRLDAKHAAPLVDVLTTRSNYRDGMLACMFMPHHVLELRTATKRETVIVCLQCGQIRFRMGEVLFLARDMEDSGSLAKAIESAW